MKVIGLTGGVATGKTTVAKQFAQLGVKIFNADTCVHHLLGRRGAAVDFVAKEFGKGLVKDGAIDRNALGKIVFADAEKLKKLEAILHPLVRAEEQAFLDRHRRARTRAVLLDIPLLFETGTDILCDITAVTHCPRFLQLHRALSRLGMTEEKLRGILARQMNDAERIARADLIIPTGRGKAASLKVVKRMLGRIHYRP